LNITTPATFSYKSMFCRVSQSVKYATALKKNRRKLRRIYRNAQDRTDKRTVQYNQHSNMQHSVRRVIQHTVNMLNKSANK